ncbi:MAG: preprotein translocase subunit SecE [Vulcanimicrobiaceae bacterium]
MNKAPGGTSKRDGGKKPSSALNRGVASANQRSNQASPQEFVRGVVLELRRVTWPTRDEWVSATVLTVLLVVGIGLFTWICDQLFGLLFNWIHPV